MEENEEERRAELKKFYRIYRELQKRHSLRERSHFDLYGDNRIEIWEYAGEQKKRCICKVEGESETECYRRAAETLEGYRDIYYGKDTVNYEKRAG